MFVRYKTELLKRLIPQPQKVEIGNETLTLENGIVIKISSGVAGGAGIVESEFLKFWEVSPVVMLTDTKPSPEVQYSISVQHNAVEILFHTMEGCRNAVRTLRQLADPMPGSCELQAYQLPECEISDSPVTANRFIHLSITPETDEVLFEKAIRLAAYYKFNYVVIESWGVFPFASHPEFGWGENGKSIDFFRHIVNVANECGIKIVPQFNILGHASGAGLSSSKHVILNSNPRLAPLFEPNGWCFCISNPETRKILQELVGELHDFYGNPEYFHIGCDEAHGLASCRNCATYLLAELLSDFLSVFRDMLKKLGSRTIMWHDMMLNKHDPAWAGCEAWGNEETQKISGIIPKDIIVALWHYSAKTEGDFPTTLFFKNAGFDTMLCPWLEENNIWQVGAAVERENLFGFLGTTWGLLQTAALFIHIMTLQADTAWRGKNVVVDPGDNRQHFARHLRDIQQDMPNAKSYQSFGASVYQQYPYSVARRTEM